MTHLAQNFAHRIQQIGAFKDKTCSPGGKGFKLKLHQTKPDAPLSPIYFDLRLLQSDFWAKRSAVELFTMMLLTTGSAPPNLLGAIPEAIVAVVSSLSDVVKIPMITPRQPKSHASGAKIDGIWSVGQQVVLFDDVITEADSKLQAALTVRDAGLIVEDVLVLLDREQGGAGKLEEAGLRLHAAMTVTDLLNYYRAEGLISNELYQEIQDYRAAAV